MKLRPECMRDILLYLEEHLTITSELEISEIDIFELMESLDYPSGEIANTLLALDEAGFIDSDCCYASNCIDDLIISRITYSGYQFLETIRPETVWHKIQSALTTIGSASLPIIQELGCHFAFELLNQQ